MILNHIEKAFSSQILSKSQGKFIVSDKSFEDLLDNYKMLKLDPPNVIRSKINK